MAFSPNYFSDCFLFFLTNVFWVLIIQCFCRHHKIAPFTSVYIRSATLSFADLLLGFAFSSSSPGTIGFLVIISISLLFWQIQVGNSGGQMQSLYRSLNWSLTILSSRE